MILPPPSSTLFPYTTLFRSSVVESSRREPGDRSGIPHRPAQERARAQVRVSRNGGREDRSAHRIEDSGLERAARGRRRGRSEEHTSELQSQSNLVCRLLLEK